MAGSISIRDLTVTRGSFTLRVDELEIVPREVFAILGRTGSGNVSTALSRARLMAGSSRARRALS